jgi:hypothetical protein
MTSNNGIEGDGKKPPRLMPGVVEVASLPRQSLRMNIRRLLGALRLTTSECSSQSRQQIKICRRSCC